VNDFIHGGRDGRRDECRGDLLARERRGELSGSDCLALRAHLAECSSCQVARRVFVDFDDVSGVDLHDGARIERMSSVARRWAHQRNRPVSRLWKSRRRLRALGLAACVLLIGGTASATVWLWKPAVVFRLYSIMSGDLLPQLDVSGPSWRPSRRSGGSSASPSTGPVSASIPTGSETTASGIVAPAVSPPEAAQVASSKAGASGRSLIRSASRHSARVASETAPTPASLLREASDWRREGDAERAIRLYRKFQRDFPDSSEALVSSVAIGGLLLERKAPRSAVAQFDAYLGSSRGGALIPEALYGRGRALAVLGDRQEERQSWERLLANFPDSAYAPLARRRLADLE
jgi:TolA-binding protein